MTALLAALQALAPLLVFLALAVALAILVDAVFTVLEDWQADRRSRRAARRRNQAHPWDGRW